MPMSRTALRRTILAVTLAAIVAAILVLTNLGPRSVTPPCGAGGAGKDCAPGFEGATGWLGTPGDAPVPIASLRGQVVLVDFWTYSCINCIRTLPHVTQLYDTYHPYGLTVIGVHTPEFGFERDAGNVAKAMAEHGIHYPVAQDNDDAIWQAYGNNAWPHDYVVDATGQVVAQHIGEGGYAQTEQEVRKLLVEAGHPNLPPAFETPDQGGVGTTPELYAAEPGRSVLANAEGYHPGADVTYSAIDDATAQDGAIYVSGTWHDGDEQLTARDNGTIVLRFHGAAANVVLDGVTGCLPVFLDGAPIPPDLAGPSVDKADHCLRVAGADSYDVVAGPPGSHLLRVDVPPGLQLYTFDFGG